MTLIIKHICFLWFSIFIFDNFHCLGVDAAADLFGVDVEPAAATDLFGVDVDPAAADLFYYWPAAAAPYLAPGFLEFA